jgi:hypothetical protein
MQRGLRTVLSTILLTAAAALISPSPFPAGLASAVPPAQPARINAVQYLEHVKVLASDEIGGRGNGTDGLDRAAEYIAAQFRSAGLLPAYDRSFFQPFVVDARVEPPRSATLTIDGAGGRQILRLGQHYYPLAIIDRSDGRPAPVLDRLPVVFAGYGISAPALAYDDYAGIDVRGKVVLVFTHEPQEHDAASPFEGTALTPAAAILAKAQAAAARGAQALLVVEDPSHAVDRVMRGSWWSDPQAEEMDIPVLRVSRDAARRAAGIDLEAAARRIDSSLQPQSRLLPDAAVTYVERRARIQARVRNVIGVLAGSSPELAGEAVVIGGHYDHLGTGGRFSSAPESTGDVHNGADDNASGIAAIVEMARAAARSRPLFPRTLVFAAFAGEEIGLRGSTEYVARAAVPITRTRAMLNLDMIGRAHGRVMVGLFGDRPWLTGLRETMRPWTRLIINDFKDGYLPGQSDDAAFGRAGVPAVAFFTGFHADYHRPSDDWQRIDADGGAAIANLALAVVEHLASATYEPGPASDRQGSFR